MNSEQFQIITIEVLHNNTALKERYLELAKKHNADISSSMSLPEYFFQ